MSAKSDFADIEKIISEKSCLFTKQVSERIVGGDIQSVVDRLCDNMDEGVSLQYPFFRFLFSIYDNNPMFSYYNNPRVEQNIPSPHGKIIYTIKSDRLKWKMSENGFSVVKEDIMIYRMYLLFKYYSIDGNWDEMLRRVVNHDFSEDYELCLGEIYDLVNSEDVTEFLMVDSFNDLGDIDYEGLPNKQDILFTEIDIQIFLDILHSVKLKASAIYDATKHLELNEPNFKADFVKRGMYIREHDIPLVLEERDLYAEHSHRIKQVISVCNREKQIIEDLDFINSLQSACAYIDVPDFTEYVNHFVQKAKICPSIEFMFDFFNKRPTEVFDSDDEYY